MAGNVSTGMQAGKSIGRLIPIPGAGMVGEGIGAAVGGLTSIVEGIQAHHDKKQADALQPSLYDPQQQAFLAEINQKRKSINSGSAFAADMGDINQSQAGTDQAITQSGGGDAGGTIAGLLAAQTNAGRLKNQVFGQADAQGQFYNTFGSNLTDAIAGRKLQLQLADQAQKRAQWAQNSQDAFGNAANAAARTSKPQTNWADIFHRHGAPDLSDIGGSPFTDASGMTPMQNARGLDETSQFSMSGDNGDQGGQVNAFLNTGDSGLEDENGDINDPGLFTPGQ